MGMGFNLRESIDQDSLEFVLFIYNRITPPHLSTVVAPNTMFQKIPTYLSTNLELF